jgi:hypothetical protein
MAYSVSVAVGDIDTTHDGLAVAAVAVAANVSEVPSRATAVAVRMDSFIFIPFGRGELTDGTLSARPLLPRELCHYNLATGDLTRTNYFVHTVAGQRRILTDFAPAR